jgi:hypothetical protein
LAGELGEDEHAVRNGRVVEIVARIVEGPAVAIAEKGEAARNTLEQPREIL